jgi:UDP-N-acetylglucosamine 1-carboxyvinyltransferase
MDKMAIKGGATLNGEVTASGAKNSALALIFASLLAAGKHCLKNVPQLKDIESACALMNALGCKTEFIKNELYIEVPEKLETLAHYDIVRKMRASILCLGPLLAREKNAKVSLPGGCAIGARPINLHLEALGQMNAKMDLESGYVVSTTSGLKGAHIVFDFPTVGGTENIMMAASLADGETIIENAAKEPEIVDLANYMISMGAKIEGAGTSTLKIQGVSKLKSADHTVIPDRIEVGTLLVAGAITGGEVTVRNAHAEHLAAFLGKLKDAGATISSDKNSITLKSNGVMKGVDITTAPHPGFPTDLQAQFMALMTQADGVSIIRETVFENRFMHVQELLRMNAHIHISSNTATITGKPDSLLGAQVMATDLRASACLVLAGLVAKNETTVGRIYHLDRGYEGLEQKLSHLGANIQRVSG